MNLQIKAYQTQDGKWHVDHPSDGVWDYSGANAQDHCNRVVTSWNSHNALKDSLELLLDFIKIHSGTTAKPSKFILEKATAALDASN